ncbi:MAG: porin [Chryseobacterium sp.]|uniref:porin n=1 Tax=Chryseobacterium sp. TaxID=1871047 RepID=UPI0025BDBC7F|nr:porin [Chryseobacterium sp.]MCJ7933854.1 porin [Chryseobacterium sp.]
MEVQENASRIGLEIDIKKGNWKIIAGGEIQVNMFKGGTSFNADGSLSGGFLTLQSEQKQQVFGNRLGYLGLDFGQYGVLTIGKQWSVYRDITSYTDRFNVFGARASATFIGGTDGGETGTGRADQSIIYRNRIGSFYVGGQIQARGGNNGKFIDGFGMSLQVELLHGLFTGVAYNRALLSENLINSGRIMGLTGHPDYFSLGARYSNPTLDFSVVGVLQKNGDFSEGTYDEPSGNSVKSTVVFNAKGLEIFGRYKFRKVFILAGYNLYKPDVNHIQQVSGQYQVYPGFKKNDFIIGVSYHPVKFVQIYSEQRFSAGKTSIGENEKSVFTLGLRIDLSKKFSRSFSL